MQAFFVSEELAIQVRAFCSMVYLLFNLPLFAPCSLSIIKAIPIIIQNSQA